MSSVLHDPLEIIIICKFGSKKCLIVILL